MCYLRVCKWPWLVNIIVSCFVVHIQCTDIIGMMSQCRCERQWWLALVTQIIILNKENALLLCPYRGCGLSLLESAAKMRIWFYWQYLELRRYAQFNTKSRRNSKCQHPTYRHQTWTWNQCSLALRLVLIQFHTLAKSGFDPSWLSERKYSSSLYKTDIGKV